MSGRDQRKTTSQPVTILLLMTVAIVIFGFSFVVVAVAEILVFKMMGGLRVIGVIRY